MTLFAPAPSGAQVAGGWSFQDDAFAELWFHGLAVIGLHGFGTLPLYDPTYALAVREERAGAGLAPTPLERQRATFLAAFQGDDAFEVVHFVPLYLAGADPEAALRALRTVAALPPGTPDTEGATRLGAPRAVASGPARAAREATSHPAWRTSRSGGSGARRSTCARRTALAR